MPIDNRYYGIYRGKIVSTDDPSGIGRVTLQVPQVFGTDVTTWAYPIIGVPENKKVPYGSFFDYTNQYAGNKTATANSSAGGALVDTPVAMRLNTTDTTATQLTYVDGGSNTQITFQKAGIYNFQWSGQFESSDVSAQDITVWLRQANVSTTSTTSENDIAGSTGLISVPGTHGGVNGHTIVGWNYLINAKANDYIELWWSTSSVNVFIATFATHSSPTWPSTASVVATLDLVGGFTPSVGDNAWVMFEGGDPNYPLWLGTF